ncbi:hypothetical protein, partial [Pseudomonas sp. MWU12-2323]|uniref:hypothetical protein n=1 Tax=Pseudomonas sp. MWU12-2323 TaxID=2651296 RepID=UPI001C498574
MSIRLDSPAFLPRLPSRAGHSTPMVADTPLSTYCNPLHGVLGEIGASSNRQLCAYSLHIQFSARHLKL